MTRVGVPQSWLSDLVMEAEQQAPEDVKKQAELIGRSVGELIERIWQEDPKRGMKILAVINRAVDAEDIKLR